MTAFSFANQLPVAATFHALDKCAGFDVEILNVGPSCAGPTERSYRPKGLFLQCPLEDSRMLALLSN